MLAAFWLAVFFNVLLASAFKGDSGCGWYICINATVHGDSVTYELTLLDNGIASRPLGWLALGFGRRMKNTHMVIMWPNEDNSTTLSQRFSTGHTEPWPVRISPRPATVSASRLVPWSPDKVATLAFEIPLDRKHRGAEASAERLIWAYSMTRPNSSHPNERLTEHYMAGFVTLDLSKEQPNTALLGSVPEVVNGPVWVDDKSPTAPIFVPSSEDEEASIRSHERLILVHGILGALGFLVLLPGGALAARWTRTTTPNWIFAHKLLNYYLAIPTIALGWILGPLSVMDSHAEHFLDAHQTCGFLLLLLYLFQLYVGRYIHARRGLPGRGTHPPSNVFHVIMGITLILLAFFQVRSGIIKLGHDHPAFYTLWRLWAMILPVIYFAGLILLRRQFHQERNGIHGTTYNSLGRDPLIERFGPETVSAPNGGLYTLNSGAESLVSVPLLGHRQG